MLQCSTSRLFIISDGVLQCQSGMFPNVRTLIVLPCVTPAPLHLRSHSVHGIVTPLTLHSPAQTLPALPPLLPPPRAPALFSSPASSLTADMTAGGEWPGWGQAGGRPHAVMPPPFLSPYCTESSQSLSSLLSSRRRGDIEFLHLNICSEL